MEDLAPSATKSVVFIPLSPQSSRTLRRHRKTHEQDTAPGTGLSDQVVQAKRPNFSRRRSDSDPSADRPLVQRHRRRRDEPPRLNEDEVEVLPDRFDSAGRPIDAAGPRPVHIRRGDFEYRPRSRSGTHVQGAWGVQGTDPEMVNRMAESVGSLLQGRQGLLGILGNVLTNLPGSSGVVGDGGGGGARGAIGYDQSDEDDTRRKGRRPRRRRDEDYN